MDETTNDPTEEPVLDSDPGGNSPHGLEGDLGISSERVGPVAGTQATHAVVPTYDDPAATPRSTGPNGSVPAVEDGD